MWRTSCNGADFGDAAELIAAWRCVFAINAMGGMIAQSSEEPGHRRTYGFSTSLPSRRGAACYGGNMGERPEDAPDAAHEANDDYVPHEAEEFREAAKHAKPPESDDSDPAEDA